jgi:hypothetical protein
MATHDIRPTGRYPEDLNRVQEEIDAAAPGDTILLKARNQEGIPTFFHFGDDASGKGSINLTKDITIAGENLGEPHPFLFPNGRTPDAGLIPDRTVVYGGERPFRCKLVNATATKLTVRNVYFAYPTLAAVQVGKSAGLEVSDCIVYDVVSGMSDVGFSVATGIEATGLGATKNGAAPDLTGDFRVFDNTVKRSEDDPTTYARADTGIILQMTDMKASIRHNRIQGFALAGIGIDKSEGKQVLVSNNTVIRCGYGDGTGQGSAEAAGIGVKRTSAPRPQMLALTNNTIIGGPVAGVGGAPLTSKNGISLMGSSWISVHANDVVGTVSADGIHAASLTDSAGTKWTSTNNQITGNDLGALSPGREYVFVDTDCTDNIVKGNKVAPGVPA